MILLDLVRKNFLLLLRSRSSAAIIVLGPLVLIFLAGLAFDHSNLYSVRVSSFAPDSSPLVESFHSALTAAQFRISEAPSLDACQQAVRDGESHACMSFSPAFALGGKSGEITFFVDYSRINLVGSIVDVLSSRVGLRTTELSRNLSTSLLDAIDVTRRTVRQKRSTLVTLATRNDEMLQGVSRARASLDGLDITLNVEAFGIGSASNASAQVAERWVLFANESVPQLNGLIVSLAKVRSDVNSSSLDNSTKSNLTSSLEAAVNQTLALRSLVNRSVGDASLDASSLNASLAGLSGEIFEARSRLDSLSSAKNGTSLALDALRVQLDASLLLVLDMQQGINEIDKALQSVQVTDPGTVAQPVRTTVKPVSAERTYLNYLFPSLIVLVIAFTALLLAPALVLAERQSPAVFRNYMSPVPDVVFVAANLVTASLVLLAQVVLILLVASVVFSVPLLGALPAILPAFVLISLFALLGVIVGEIFVTQETATLAGISLASVAMFLSDVVVPLESMPDWLASVARLNPVVIGGSILRRMLLFGASVSSVGSQLAVLVLYVFVAAVLVWAVHLLAKRHMVARLLHYKRRK